MNTFNRTLNSLFATRRIATRTSARQYFAKRLHVERLEDRRLLAGDVSISIGDASTVEGDLQLTFLDDFVNANYVGTALPRAVVIGPDGYLYVSSGVSWQSTGDSSNFVSRFDAQTGEFVDVAFSSSDSGIFFDLPWAMEFGPDNKLYVAGRRSNNVVRYDPSTDALEEFVGSGNGVYRPAGLTFGSDGSLYVANSDSGDFADTESMRNQVVQLSGPNSTN